MPRINDQGILIDVVTNVDVSTVSGVWFKVTKPDMSVEVWPAQVVSSGDGRLRHTTSGTDLDQAGEYLVSPLVHFTFTKSFHTPAFRFETTDLYIP